MNISRILKNIVITSNGCWEWQKSCNSSGYGQLMENKIYWLVHRYVYQCIHGNLQKEDIVRHKCHNTKCCNPDHLIVGNSKDIIGMILKKLTEKQQEKEEVSGG